MFFRAKQTVNILIVDDDPTMRQMLRKAMEKAGFDVFDANNGYTALYLLQHHPISVMILDMQMPQLDGVATMRQACQIQPELQIIVLTGNPTLDNAIASIRASVADYFVKPVDLLTLTAAVSRAAAYKSFSQQIDSMLKQMSQPAAQPSAPVSPMADELVVFPLRLQKGQRLLTLADKPLEPIKLSRGETAVLYTLMSQPNTILTCAKIVFQAFGYHTHSVQEAENVVRPYISRLRQKIEPNPRDPQYLQTTHGHGYRFVRPTNIQFE